MLRDATGNEITADNDGDGGFELSATLNRGIFYTSVTAIEVGAYRILAQIGSSAPKKEGSNDTFTDALSSGGEGPEMVIIPAGSFRMGCLKEDLTCEANELPVHEVHFDRPFALSATEVTIAQWDRCAEAYVCRQVFDSAGLGGDASRDRPIIISSYLDADDYITWLSSKTEETYRLPNEAEWEYAARAGTTTRYPWGDEIGVNHAHCRGCDGQAGIAIINTVPVRSFVANQWGLYDMVGNVSELTADCGFFSYENAPSDGSVWRNDCTLFRDYYPDTMRGGSAYDTPRDLRVARRAGASFLYTGFRVARTITP